MNNLQKFKILNKWSRSIYKNTDDIIVSSPSFKDYFINELNIKDKSFIMKALANNEVEENSEQITYDEEGNPVPYKLTYVLKSDQSTSILDAKAEYKLKKKLFLLCQQK